MQLVRLLVKVALQEQLVALRELQHVAGVALEHFQHHRGHLRVLAARLVPTAMKIQQRVLTALLDFTQNLAAIGVLVVDQEHFLQVQAARLVHRVRLEHSKLEMQQQVVQAVRQVLSHLRERQPVSTAQMDRFRMNNRQSVFYAQ